MTSEVGSYKEDRTLQGVMDMAGNVREWCRDKWALYDQMPPDGPVLLPDEPPPGDDTSVVVRGGSYYRDVSFRFVTHRQEYPISADPTKDIGFRVVIEDVRPKP